ncbi:MAG: glycosyltransferase family 4 protein [Cyanobacteria bacterium J06623_5]
MTSKSIALFDFSITQDSPAGSCVLQLVKNLAKDYHFTVFADRFDNPAPHDIDWVRVPLPRRPVVLRYVLFKYLAPFYYRRFVQRRGTAPELIIATEGEFVHCDICYVHFCHRAYLQQRQLKIASARAIARLATHHFNARAEAEAISQAKAIVTPSLGLARELGQTYASTAKDKILTLPNPIDIHHFTKPEHHSSADLRTHLGLHTEDIVLVFTALGDFERKGLRLVVQAFAKLRSPQLKLLVVGGNDHEISEYAAICQQLNVSDNIRFVGFQSDIRPYLWLSDAFILPSAYETFSLAAFQAAIAGLPVIATQLYGVEDFLQPGINGWLIERTESSIIQTLKSVVTHQEQLSEMGQQAHLTGSQFGVPLFIESWRQLLETTLANTDLTPLGVQSTA